MLILQRFLRVAVGVVTAFVGYGLLPDPNDHLRILGTIMLATGVLMVISANFMKAASGSGRGGFGTRDRLASVLLRWSENDFLTCRDLLNGGVACFGRSGSGKTSSSGKALARAVVGIPGSGGLILAAKPGEDLELWRGIFREAGREGDLLVFSPENDLRFNFIDYEMQAGGHTRNITKCITVIGETLRGSDAKGGENSSFWEQEQARMIYNAVEIIKQATGKVSAPDIQKFITGAATNPAQIASPQWQAGFHNQCLKTAFEKPKSPTDQHDFDLASDYWLAEFVNMADKTRSSILTGVMGILHVFNTGLVRSLVSTTTNVTPDDMFAGKWVLIDMSPSEWGDIGNFVCAGWKYLTQRRNLRRKAGPDDAINVIWCDEAQMFLTSFDATYLAQCRSHRGAMVFLTQSIHSYYSTLSGEQGRHQVDALLTNFGAAKIFHALGDVQTAEYAASLVGKSLQTFVGGSMAPHDEPWDEIRGQSTFTGSFNQHYEAVLQNNVFMNGLRTGGEHNGLLCDCIVVRSGQPFANGENWLWTTFSQK